MTFANLSLAGLLGGLAAIATLLYVLQRLRIRHRVVTVATTLFWRAAAEEAPARTFRERFRHPWAYALFLLIAALLWLAFAGPASRPQSEAPFQVLVMDGSAGMAVGTRYADAVAALRAHLRGLPADRRQVLWSGGSVRPLLNPGEHALLLEKRLADLAPEAAPAGVEALLRQLAVEKRTGGDLQVVIFGDAPVRSETLALLPHLSVTRADSDARRVEANTGITALGVVAAASGAWDRVDVYVRVEGSSPTAPALRATLDDRALPATDLRPVSGAAAGSFLLLNLPAAGGLLTFELEVADALKTDNRASLRLPNRPKLRVALSPSLDAVLRTVLTADPAVELVGASADAQVAIRQQGELLGADLPALEFVPAAAQPAAFLIVHPATLEPAVVFEHAVKAIGLKEIDAMALAEASGRSIEVTVSTGPQWQFAVWQELLSEQFNFTQSRAFPLFVANAVRWLAGAPGGYAYVAAGQPLPEETWPGTEPILDAQGLRLDYPGVPFVPDKAGELAGQGGSSPLMASLLDPGSTLSWTGGALAPAKSVSPGFDGRRILLWLLLAAFVLLGWEWYLHQTGRVP